MFCTPEYTHPIPPTKQLTARSNAAQLPEAPASWRTGQAGERALRLPSDAFPEQPCDTHEDHYRPRLPQIAERPPAKASGAGVQQVPLKQREQPSLRRPPLPLSL